MSVVERIPERRIAPRIEAESRILVTERTAKADLPCDEELLVPLFGRALNLSETGILIEVDEPLCVGRHVTVTVDLEDRQVRLHGRIVRSSLVKGTRRVRLGIEFDGIDATVHKAIRKALRETVVCAHLN